MIRLLKLTLRNFNNVSFAEIDLDSPTILLVGDNGCGKSSVVDAIALCLADRKRSDTLGYFVKNGTSKAEIELFAEIEGNPLYFDIKIIKSDSQTTTDRLARYLGKEYTGSDVTVLIKSLELDYYSDIFISMQGGDDITKMSPAVRSAYIQKLLAFSFDTQTASLDESIKKSNESITNTNAQIVALQNNIESLKKQIQPKRELTEADLQELNTLKDRKAVLQQYITDNTAALRKNAIVNAEKARLTDELLSLQEKYSMTEKQVAAAKTAETTIAELTEQNKDYDTQLSQFSESIGNLNNKVVELENQIKQDDTAYNSALDALSQAKADYKAALENFNKVNQDKCPYCGQPIPEGDKTHFAELQKEAEANVASKTEELNNLSQARSQKNKDKENASSELRKLTNDNSVVNVLKNNNLTKITACQNLLDTSKESLSLLSSLNDEISGKKQAISEKDADLVQIDNDLWNKNQTELDQCDSKITNYQQIIDNNNLLEVANANIEKNIQAAELSVSEQTSTVAKYSDDLDTYKEAYQIFGKKLPQFIIVKTCTSLENKLNSYVRNIFPNLYLKLLYKKKGVEFFYATNCPTIPDEISEDDMLPIKQASGFEKAVLSLCFKAVLCEAYNLPFCILDEVDAAASDSNSKKLFEIIINGGFFRQSIIISHKPAVIESIKSMAESVSAYTVDNGVFSVAE